MLLLISGLGDENTKLEFGQIYEKNYRTMYYVALKILKSKEEAEDAVHGAFVKLAEKYDTYRHLTSQEMTSLCVIIVKNKCLDMLRVSKSGLQSDLEKVDYAAGKCDTGRGRKGAFRGNEDSAGEASSGAGASLFS